MLALEEQGLQNHSLSPRKVADVKPTCMWPHPAEEVDRTSIDTAIAFEYLISFVFEF